MTTYRHDNPERPDISMSIHRSTRHPRVALTRKGGPERRTSVAVRACRRRLYAPPSRPSTRTVSSAIAGPQDGDHSGGPVVVVVGDA